MATIQDSSDFLVPIQTAWDRLADFSLWSGYHIFPAVKGSGFGDTPRLVEGEGPSAKLGLFDKDMLMQTYSVTQWTPPQRLILTLDPWKWESGTYSDAGRIPGALGRFIGSMKALDSSISIDLSPISPGETRVALRIHFHFTHVLMGPMLNLLLGLKLRSLLRQCAANFIKHFAQSL